VAGVRFPVTEFLRPQNTGGLLRLLKVLVGAGGGCEGVFFLRGARASVEEREWPRVWERV
jgi:hypothetical protein